jgi:hypothetical protein
MTIHTIGDSHCNAGFGMISGIITHYIQDRLCYSVGRDGLDVSDFGIKENDTIVFCFGEIDCRCQIHKRISNSNPYDVMINNIVHKYFEKIEIMVKSLPKVKIFVFNVVPPVRRNETCENKDYPFLGTDDDRKKYVLYFNNEIKKKCLEYNYGYFDVYDKYVDENGFLNKNLSDGSVHIRNPKFIQNFIYEQMGDT